MRGAEGCGGNRSLLIDACIRAVCRNGHYENVEHISYKHVQPLHPIFFTIKIASHPFPAPRFESESRLFECDILKRSELLIFSTIRYDRHDFTDNRLLRACRGQRFAFVRQIASHDEHEDREISRSTGGC